MTTLREQVEEFVLTCEKRCAEIRVQAAEETLERLKLETEKARVELATAQDQQTGMTRLINKQLRGDFD